MPKISIYLPDELYAEVRRQDLPISALAQEALRHALESRVNRDWIERARGRESRTSATIDTSKLLDDVREEFGA